MALVLASPGVGSTGSGTEGLASWASSGPSSFFSSSMPMEIEYGANLAFAFCAGTIGFNESLVLFALSSQSSSKRPGVAAAGGSFGRSWRRDEIRRGTNASDDHALSPASSVVSAALSVRGSSLGAASSFIGSRKPLAAQTHPRSVPPVDQA